jgi:hypothetical protein
MSATLALIKFRGSAPAVVLPKLDDRFGTPSVGITAFLPGAAGILASLDDVRLEKREAT